MRDFNRIDPIINKLRDLWKTNPDLRLGQLLDIITTNSGDLFSIEDTEMEDSLNINLQEGLINNVRNKGKI